MRLAISPIWLVFTLIFAFSLSCHGEAMAVETSLLKGKVTDFEGKPVEDAVIFIYQSTNTRRQPDFVSPGSDREGRFTISLPPARYWAVARVKKGEEMGPVLSGGKHSGEPAEIEIVPGKDSEQDFVVAEIREVARAGRKTGEEVVRIAGRILDGDGKPVKMAYAIANRSDSFFEVPDYLSGWTDETGAYALYLPRGKYFIGGSATFPPDQKYRADRELISESEKSDVDIAIRKHSDTTQQGSAPIRSLGTR